MLETLNTQTGEQVGRPDGLTASGVDSNNENRAWYLEGKKVRFDTQTELTSFQRGPRDYLPQEDRPSCLPVAMMNALEALRIKDTHRRLFNHYLTQNEFIDDFGSYIHSFDPTGIARFYKNQDPNTIDATTYKRVTMSLINDNHWGTSLLQTRVALANLFNATEREEDVLNFAGILLPLISVNSVVVANIKYGEFMYELNEVDADASLHAVLIDSYRMDQSGHYELRIIDSNFPFRRAEIWVPIEWLFDRAELSKMIHISTREVAI
ncbi:MAG: hypothetical protein QY330_02885 [Candidatus Dojkabacteria bacterium]|uniref:Uncharacterized protein n=2 Tax=Candidatus Dojkabacteria TaxID=74243 RepID=A0A136KK58_9BACT|nr:MAG: hypothetical protein UZ20_WS6002000348 [candidate division WS6 bacterium OLB21]MBW7953732.1 hypothetical protein [Candidatus Dojkabacteria bacterium]WKZ27468.1 MAG: hypothetical protein QY330_02885 [Candidatus Dojkabacteria bacterium]